MSRPQFNKQNSRYCSSAESYGGGVVNGGLIDFQDNSNRGVPIDYSHSMDFNAVAPSVLQGLGMTQRNAGALPGCFTGPPTYLHVNGVTYRPVETTEPPRAVAAPAVLPPSPADPVSSTASEHDSGAGGGSVGVSTKILSEAELNRIVDERVRQRVSTQVQGYFTRKPAALDIDPADELGSRRRSRSEYMERTRYSDEGEEPRGRTVRETVPRTHERVERARYDDDDRDPSLSRRHDDSDRRLVRDVDSAPRRGGRDADMETAAERVRSANASMSERLGGRLGSRTMRW